MPVPMTNLKSQKAIKEMGKAFPHLAAKIKASDIEVQLYITALETDNLKLQRTIAKQGADYLLFKGQIQIRAEEGAARIVEESELIAKTEKEVSERMKHMSPRLKRLIKHT